MSWCFGRGGGSPGGRPGRWRLQAAAARTMSPVWEQKQTARLAQRTENLFLFSPNFSPAIPIQRSPGRRRRRRRSDCNCLPADVARSMGLKVGAVCLGSPGSPNVSPCFARLPNLQETSPASEEEEDNFQKIIIAPAAVSGDFNGNGSLRNNCNTGGASCRLATISSDSLIVLAELTFAPPVAH